ncbi:hypothetical protein L0F63_002540 [Massospora cicadina]|nr:hypothetical protein L0F63_002540 [Massospora cicadina]
MKTPKRRRHEGEGDLENEGAQRENSESPADEVVGDEREDSGSEGYSDPGEEDDYLEGELAYLEGFAMPDLQNLPLQFDPSQANSQTIDLTVRDIVGSEKLLVQQIEALTEVASQAEELDMKDEVQKMDEIVKSLLDQVYVVQSYKRCFNKFRSALLQAGGNPIDGSLVAALEKATSEEIEAYQAKSAQTRYNGLDLYKEFRQRIWEVNHPEEVMPPLGEEGEAEADLVVARQIEPLRCPLTATWFEDPVTSADCNHSFSKAAVTEILRASLSGIVKCPVAGCSKNLAVNLLKPNPALARRLERARVLHGRNAHMPSSQGSQFTVLE